ncbi:MAG: hypothetical protein ABI185_11510, partial [Ginsengibacter sp.]
GSFIFVIFYKAEGGSTAKPTPQPCAIALLHMLGLREGVTGTPLPPTVGYSIFNLSPIKSNPFFKFSAI